MNSKVLDWAHRWNIPLAAMLELREIFVIEKLPVPEPHKEATEAFVQSLVRLEAAQKGLKLWRNNVGAFRDERGVPVRFGLGNDSERLNKVIKSGDLIGWRPLLITPAHVGSRVAQFVSRECKRPDWRYTGTDREVAQLRWAEAVTADGGDAAFCKGAGTL